MIRICFLKAGGKWGQENEENGVKENGLRLTLINFEQGSTVDPIF